MEIFEVGKFYIGKFAKDSDFRYEFKILDRSENQIKISYDNVNGYKWLNVKLDKEGNETTSIGRYSKAPTIKAKRL